MSYQAILVLLLLPVVVAAEAPSFSRDVRPFLAKYCVECHSKKKPTAGFNVETYELLMEGSSGGPVVTPGKAKESHIMLLMEGKDKPRMPPAKYRQPTASELDLIRQWIADGAKNDTGSANVTLPEIPAKPTGPPAVTALDYHPSGKFLAVGTYGEVWLFQVTENTVLGKLGGQTGKVSALRFSADGNWLAVASGVPGSRGEVRLYFVPPSGLPAKFDHNILAHQDVVQTLAFSPDSSLLGTGSYDKLVKLWNVDTGELARTLKDHSDAVYGLAFRADGRLLATVGADRALKIWETKTGKRLYTLGESNDALHTVVWHPHGKSVAAAGSDKSVRVWLADERVGKLTQSAFAHDAPVLRLAFSKTGDVLYTLSEDRTFKAWEAARLVERYQSDKFADTPLSLALAPDGKHLAIGLFSGMLHLVDSATGKESRRLLPRPEKPDLRLNQGRNDRSADWRFVQFEKVPGAQEAQAEPSAKGPQITKIAPDALVRGKSTRVILEGKNLPDDSEVSASHSGIEVKVHGRSEERIELEILASAEVPVGFQTLSVAGGNVLSIAVDWFPTELHSPERPTTKIPTTIVGRLDRSGSVHRFPLKLKADEELGVQVSKESASKLDPVLTLVDSTGRVLLESESGLLGYRSDTGGSFTLTLRDREFRGDPAMTYRLHMGPIPVVTGVFPLALPLGRSEVELRGVNLGKQRKLSLDVTGADGTKVPVVVPTPQGSALGSRAVTVSPFPAVYKPGAIRVPGAGQALLTRVGETHVWSFRGKAGEPLLIEVNARRLGSPLDSHIAILNEKGDPVERATLRCVARSFVTFRDHDSVLPGIRLEDWRELGVNDYLLVGSQLLRMRALARHPDDDCQFFALNGQRLAYLGTTPTHISFGTPIYKVELHPPGKRFPPNGFPIVPIFYRNDDGGPGFGKDSWLRFDPPADGVYQVRLDDARELTDEPGETRVEPVPYLLTIRPPKPSFTVKLSPESLTVERGGAVPLTINVERIDGYEGAIEVRFDDLPPGISIPATRVLPGEANTVLALYADASAKVSDKAMPLKATAWADPGKSRVERNTQATVKIIEPRDLVTTTKQSEVVLHPGREVTVTATIERRKGFKGRVPLDVRGLPHGVRVLDVGLNGILITEKETTRTFTLYCEPWVEPMSHPFVVLARREGDNTEHAARSVLLRVEK